jgi:hypothetical protein
VTVCTDVLNGFLLQSPSSSLPSPHQGSGKLSTRFFFACFSFPGLLHRNSASLGSLRVIQAMAALLISQAESSKHGCMHRTCKSRKLGL